MQILMTMIAAWLAANLGLPPTSEIPDLRFVAPAAMQEARYQAAGGIPSESVALSETPEVESFYDDASGTIYLPDGWTGTTPTELSLLVHEMVHHLQSVGGLTYACSAAREKPAYRAQRLWLEQFGQGLEEAFGLDAMTLLVRTSCMF